VRAGAQSEEQSHPSEVSSHNFRLPRWCSRKPAGGRGVAAIERSGGIVAEDSQTRGWCRWWSATSRPSATYDLRRSASIAPAASVYVTDEACVTALLPVGG
jgi:hypothetical protein